MSGFIINPYIHGGGGGGGSPISLIASIGEPNTFDGNHNTTTDPIDTSGATLLVMAIPYFSGFPDATYSDSKGNTWVALTEYSGGDMRLSIFYVKNPVVGSGHTFHAEGAGSYNCVIAAAFNETDTAANAQNESGAGSASGTTQQPGSLTPPTDDSLLVTALGFVAGSGNATINSDFTVTDTIISVGGYCVALAYKVQTSAGAENPTWTAPGAAANITAAMASFKHA